MPATWATRGWFRLDNAAKIFPSVVSHRQTQLFRLAVRLTSPIQPALLSFALAQILPRFPCFQVRLYAGFFWYSLVEERSLPVVRPDTSSPCQPDRFGNRELLKVRYFGRRLAVEFSHSLTDGIGGATFLKALVAEYLHQSGVEAVETEDLRRAHTPPNSEESHDAYQDLFDPSFPRHPTWDRAFQPQAPLLPKGRYAVTTGRFALSAVLTLARENKATLTEYLAATLLASFQDSFLALTKVERRRQARPLRLVLPVNLRPLFDSKTLRNFFVVVPVEIDLRLGEYSFPEILRKVHHQLQSEMDPKLLKKQIMRNLRGELNPAARLLPLVLKTPLLSAIHRSFELQHTASLSNLGPLSWPQPWNELVQDAEFTPPPSPLCRVNVGVVSCGTSLSLTFGNLTGDRAVERAFFTRLRRTGLSVFIESNRNVLEE